MKRIVALIIAAVLLMACGCVWAEEVNWSNLEEQAADMIAMGEFVTLDEIGMKIWIPSSFIVVDLSDEDKEEGYIGFYISEDESAVISAMCVATDGMTMDDYKEELQNAGAEEIQDVIINGLAAVSYVMTSNDTMCVAFVTDNGYIFEVAASPKSDEGFEAVAVFVMASIQNA